MEKASLPEFITKTIEDINSALPPGYAIEDAIQFEIAVTTTKTKNGELGLKVVSGKLSEDNEVSQKISFSVINSVEKEKSGKKQGDNVIKYIKKSLDVLSEFDSQPKKLNK